MLSEERASAWEREAKAALAQYFGTTEKAGDLAAIVLALLEEREALLRYVDRSRGN